ncbi:MAG: hypothetical protein RLZZ350_2514 [Verrucomicrobiota bacterium]|jgi:hypothetical protein
MTTHDSESNRILPRQYPEAEMVQVRIKFTERLANFPVNKKFRTLVMVPLFLTTVLGAFGEHFFPATSNWSRWLYMIGMSLFMTLLLGILVYTLLARKQPLPCPCCGKNVLELGKYCPQCHDPSLIHPRGDNLVRCIPCDLNFWGHNWRIKFCTHCGAQIHEEGFYFGVDSAP